MGEPTTKPLSDQRRRQLKFFADDAYQRLADKYGLALLFDSAQGLGSTYKGAPVGKFGIGEVFVGSGQSNSTNSAEVRTTTTTGMVSSFSGTDWKIADDPQLGVNDNTTLGSFYPTFGDAMYKKYKVPIGIAATGRGATSVTQWYTGGEIFSWLLTRINQLGPGGCRAVLWHQGESDVWRPSDEYFNRMCQLIRDSQ